MFLKITKIVTASGAESFEVLIINFNGAENEFIVEQVQYIANEAPMEDNDYIVSAKYNLSLAQLVEDKDYHTESLQNVTEIFNTKTPLCEVVKYFNRCDLTEKYYKIDC